MKIGTRAFKPWPQSNNSFNPTRLSLPLMIVVWCFQGCMAASAGGLIRALGACNLLNIILVIAKQERDARHAVNIAPL